jgi:hypothetical protein
LKRAIFFCIVNWITQVEVEFLHDAGTGWREPILISGQGKAVPASYCADGLVFCAFERSRTGSRDERESETATRDRF